MPLHTVEPELRGRTPRPARFTVGAQAARASLLALMFLGVGLVGWCAAQDVGDLAALRAEGRTTTAVVMGKHKTHGKTTSYYLDYGFLGNLVWVNDDEEVSSSEYDRAQMDAPLLVTFLPAHPQTHRVGVVGNARIARQRTSWTVGGLATFAVLGMLVVFTERQYRNHLYLLRDGIPVTGTVMDQHVVRGKSTTYYVRYQFPPASPGAVQTRQIAASPRLYQ